MHSLARILHFRAIFGLERARGDMCRVLDEFCDFSSRYRFRADKQGIESQPGHSQDLTSLVNSLMDAIKITVPFIETMKRLYELDIKAFESDKVMIENKQPAENLGRVAELLKNLEQLMALLDSFAPQVAELTTSPSAVRG